MSLQAVTSLAEAKLSRLQKQPKGESKEQERKRLAEIKALSAGLAEIHEDKAFYNAFRVVTRAAKIPG